MNFQNTLNSSLNSAWIILKLVIPIYIIADILYFYNTLSYISFLIEPFTSIIGLPSETALAIISGIFLNLYAAVAFAAPLDLTPHQ
ncbi:MAG: nucleoside recognition protein, partial [Arcobacteraceae bacterium]|nr:nucleoside recognition protein [Arcobacteraceae bacterium]